MEESMNGVVRCLAGLLALGLLAAAACSVKTEASDKICVPSQRTRCNCASPDPSDTRIYRGWQMCADDGKSFKGTCGECAPDSASSPLPDPTPSPDPGTTSTPPPKKEPPPGAPVPDQQSKGDGGVGGGDCPGPLAPKDLAVVEMMIATVKPGSGTNDYGEWFEVKSTRDCRLNAKGIHVESPRVVDSDVDKLDVADDLWLKANESFIVANSLDTADNHLPSGSKVVAWNPWQGLTTHDTLKDSGHDSIVISVDSRQIDRIDWDATGWGVADNVQSTVSFSVGCTWEERPNWGNWSWSNASFFSAFSGTPNAYSPDNPLGLNNDVNCAHLPPP
jgi:hypothetical protein